MKTDDQEEPSTPAVFSDARPQINFFLGMIGAGIGIPCGILGPTVVHALVFRGTLNAEESLFIGLVLGFAVGVGPGVILGGRLFRVIGRWWGAILGSLIGTAIVFHLQTWFGLDFLLYAYFIVPPVLAVAGYQPIRPRSASDRWN